MASNKKKIFITESFSRDGGYSRRTRRHRDGRVLQHDLGRRFPGQAARAAPVHGVALGATRFGETELEASGDMKVVTRIGVGFDAVDVPALSKRKVPLMVAGSANSPSVAEQALFMM